MIYTQVSKIRKDFANDLSANIKFSKTQLSKMVQLGGILMPSYFTNLINPVMDSNNIDKIQNLAKKVSDDQIKVSDDQINGDLFNLFKKEPLEEILKRVQEWR